MCWRNPCKIELYKQDQASRNYAVAGFETYGAHEEEHAEFHEHVARSARHAAKGRVNRAQEADHQADRQQATGAAPHNVN